MNHSLLKGLQHIGIPTNNLPTSITFYQTLGFRIVMEVFHEAAKEHVAFLEHDGCMIELYENKQATLRLGAIEHIAFHVSDIENLFQQMKVEGFHLLHDQPQFLPFWENGLKFFTIEGPNKEKIELSELL